jgi:hypothetical protein
MTIGGLVAAVAVGAAIGALGRLVVPGRPGMPAWLLMAAGVVAAFAGTGLALLTGLAEDGWGLWGAFLQVLLAVVGVSLVAIVWPERTHHS